MNFKFIKADRSVMKRSMVLIILLVLLFSLSVSSLVRIQIVDGEEYKQNAELQQLSDKTLSANRGKIMDANNIVLAESATAWKIYVDPSEVSQDSVREKIAEDLSEMLSLDYDSVYEKLSKNTGYEVLKRKVDSATRESIASYISENDYNKIIGIDEDAKRYYPYNQFASKIIGFTGDDDQGLSGLEKTYDDLLTGVPGRIVTATDAKQREMPVPFETTIEAQQGKSLVLTIDQVIQYYLEKNLEQAYKDNNAISATGIVMRTKTGEILAMSTKPDYDPNNPFNLLNDETNSILENIEDEDERSSKLSSALNEQWKNNAISDTYEPGSVFKMITAAAAIEEGVVDENTMFTCNGYVNVAGWRINCHNRSGHGTETFAEGLKNSCNPVFINVAQEMGVETFYEYVEAFGLTEKTGIDLIGESSSVFHNKDTMGISELSSSSFGQTFQVTPIQMITAVNAIANGGKLVQPYIVKEVQDKDGNVISSTETSVKRQVISENTASRIATMLEDVVATGTGKNAYVPGYRVAGKTGTSEKVGNRNEDGSKKYIASFCAFAPADDPEVVVLILIDEPRGGSYSGGTIVGPIVGDILESTLQYLNIEPRYTEEELQDMDVYAPNVVSQTVEQATAAIEEKGLSVRVIGSGETVVSQNPESSQPIPKDGTVILYTEEGRETAVVPDVTGMTISQANRTLLNAGLNIKISGNTTGDAEAIAYSQSIGEGREVELGTVVTVNFKQILDENYSSVLDSE